ncbi:hypothetical protein Rin_00009020 [Candidatus Regiella insecticola 5.15]|uniref:Uncharacterized protein n=1 Tax=Candidatus Regiella insecticola 5.15 TaxID=1005043 RepID=G2GYP2_9ENTR|nr:hypothetical protein Rin_00009020 [Candidatus Regiella insecticola 5.15]
MSAISAVAAILEPNVDTSSPLLEPNVKTRSPLSDTTQIMAVCPLPPPRHASHSSDEVQESNKEWKIWG